MIAKWKLYKHRKDEVIGFLSEIVLLLNENFEEENEVLDYIKDRSTDLVEEDKTYWSNDDD